MTTSSHMQNHKHTHQLLKDWIEHMQSLRYSSQTISGYRFIIKSFFSFLTARGITRIRDVTAGHIDQYRILLFNKGLSEATVFQYLRVVRMFYARLEKIGVIFVSPGTDLILPAPSKTFGPVPSEKDIRQLLKQPDTSKPSGIRDRAILEIFYSTGIRLGELVRINMEDPDFKDRTIRIQGKGNIERIVPMGQSAIRKTKQYINDARPCFIKKNPDEPALFTGIMGRRINPLTVERMVKSWGQKINLNLTPHAIRRACATHMMINGAHPSAIQVLLGHASLKILGRYLRLAPSEMIAMHKKTRPGK